MTGGVSAGTRGGLGRSLFEMALVIVSVLLALTVENWREDREKAALTQSVLGALAQELEANRAAIDEALPYQDRSSEAFRAALERYETKKEFVYPEEARTRGAAVRFSSAAYESAVIAQVLPRIKVDTLLKLSRVYAEQDAYADLLRGYSNATLLVDFADGARYFRLQSNEYAQLAEAERRILPLIEAARAAVAGELGQGRR
ncbi:hypothetical protein [Nevskia sp.]|uniref:hypothetical protein n=1 Tax=Nevskia sp. TaxID=1929292 RepID=UPI0025EDF323|nr:hypothetical protein [Nevskia sp.]